MVTTIRQSHTTSIRRVTPEIKRKIANYSKLRKIIEEFVETNIKMFKRKADP